MRAGVGRRHDVFSGPATAFLSGLAGVAPDEQGGSVLDPNSARNSKAAASAGFWSGLIAQSLPIGEMLARGANAVGAAVGARAQPAVSEMVTNALNRGGRPAQLLQDMSRNTTSNAAAWHGPLKKNDLSRNELQDLISSQRFLDRDIVAQKIRDGSFDVRVTPRFEVSGESVRAITDGHHALEAAIRSGNKPNFITDTVRTNDRVGLLNQGAIDDYLEAAYHDSPWYRFATKVDLF